MDKPQKLWETLCEAGHIQRSTPSSMISGSAVVQGPHAPKSPSNWRGQGRRQKVTSSRWGLAEEPNTGVRGKGGAGTGPELRRAVSPGVSQWLR